MRKVIRGKLTHFWLCAKKTPCKGVTSTPLEGFGSAKFGSARPSEVIRWMSQIFFVRNFTEDIYIKHHKVMLGQIGFESFVEIPTLSKGTKVSRR